MQIEMASALTLERKSQRISKLCDMFKEVDREVIQLIAEDCEFDTTRALRILMDMNLQNSQVSPIIHQQNGTKRKQMTSPQGQSQNHTTTPNGPYDPLIGFIRDGYKVMVLMRGLPGSGKSSLAINFLHHCLGSVNRDEFIFSTDDYFHNSGQYVYAPSKLEEAHGWNQRRCFANMKRGVSPIIIDNTNLKMWEMKVYCVMGVKFGYIIEILEPTTPWALQPDILSTKNSHGVDKRKIREMMERYQRNITISDLLREFKLGYNVKMPQYREYPPILPRNVPPVTVAVKPTKPQLPLEYVHTFQPRHDDSSKKDNKVADDVEFINLDSDSKHKEQTNDDLISFIGEFKSSGNTGESANPTQAEIVKQLEENKEMMNKVMDLLNKQIVTQKDTSASVLEPRIEVVDEAVSTEVPANSGANRSHDSNLDPSSRSLNDLEEENKALRALLDQTKSKSEEPKHDVWMMKAQEQQMDVDEAVSMEVIVPSEGGNKSDYSNLESTRDLEERNKSLRTILDKAKSKSEEINPFYLLSMKETQEEKAKEAKKLQTSRLEMFFQNTTYNKASSNKSEVIDLISPTPTASMLSTKNEKSSLPKFESKAWGLPEDALVSWDVIPARATFEFQSQEKDDVFVETCEQSTNTTSEDFRVARQGSSDGTKYLAQIIGRETPINGQNTLGNHNPPKRITVDKSCMTDEEELLLGLNVNEVEQVKKLMELFPGVSIEDMLYVYDKCGKDFHWTVDLISSSPMIYPSTSTSLPQEKENKGKKNLEQESRKSSLTFELNDWNVIPANLDQPKIEDETIPKKKKEEQEVKQQAKQEEVLQLKKQLEETVSIGKEHYSDHIWQLKSAKMGASTSKLMSSQVESASRASEAMTIEDDMIYVSDDSSDEDSNDDENESTEDDLVELNLGKELVQQLECMFGQLSLGENFKPIIQVPESLARQLHALYLESICHQIENQSDYITSQLKKDEEFAMRLQEAERESTSGNNLNEIMDEELAKSIYRKDIEQWKNLSPDTLALKLTRQKLHSAFPTINQKVLDEVLLAHGNNYMQTIQAIISSTNQQPINTGSQTNPMEPPISDSTLSEMKTQAQVVNKVTEEVDGNKPSAQSYRDEANRHMLKHKELQQLAQNYYKGHNYAVTMFYSDLAQKELKKADVANQHAAQCFIRENSSKLRSGDTLDLHFQYSKGALTSLDVFLDFQISSLRSSNKPFGDYFVITGWGKHNKKGKPVLKPVVMKRLTERNVKYTIVNPGMLKIKLLKDLPMSTDIKRNRSSK